jgi:hypothetical protein
MSIRPCAQYGIAIGHLMSTLERLESSPQRKRVAWARGWGHARV